MKNLNNDKLAALEAIVCKQRAEIDGLVVALSDLLAAHAVLQKDVRLFSFLKEYRDGDQRKAAKGGNRHFPASYFTERGDFFGRLLEKAAGSNVFDQYWFRSMFWRREEKRRRALEKVREAVQAKIDG